MKPKWLSAFLDESEKEQRKHLVRRVEGRRLPIIIIVIIYCKINKGEGRVWIYKWIL